MYSSVSDWQNVIIGSDNDLAPNMRQAIIWTNDVPVYWRVFAPKPQWLETCIIWNYSGCEILLASGLRFVYHHGSSIWYTGFCIAIAILVS